MVLSFYFFSLYLLVTDCLDPFDFALLSCAMPVALLGLVDDLRSLGHRYRLLVQLMPALLLVMLLGELPPLLLGSYSLDLAILTWVLVPLALIWLCNLYNFMDGIDGLAAGQCCFVAAAAAWLLMDRDPSLALLSLGLAFASAGFLVWNWPPARIFMGDVGSTWSGFLLGVLVLMTHYQQVMSVWSWVLLMGVFIVDATLTLLVRVLRGEPAAKAHSTHAYQHLARHLGSHKSVLLGVLSVNCLVLLPLAWLAHVYPEYGVLLAISGIVPLFVLAWFLGAGRPGRSRKGLQ